MKFWVGLGMIVLVVGIGGFIFLSHVNDDSGLSASQKQASLNKSLGQQAVLTSVDHSTWKTYESTVVSFSYPGWASVYTKDNDSAKQQKIILDSFHFQLADMHINSIVSVINRPDFSQISSEPGVTLRENDKSYQMVGSVSSTQVMFLNNSLGEQSFFLLKNGRVYSLIVTGGSIDVRNPIFQKMMTSLTAK